MSDDRTPAAQAPEGYDPGEYPVFFVTVDTAIFTVRDGALKILLVQRQDDPYAGCWALPGGFKNPDETLDEAAWRELAEETGVTTSGWHLEQLGSFGDPQRDPRGNIVTVAYVAFAPNLPDPVAGSDARDARFWDVDDLDLPGLRGGNHDRGLDDAPELAFDHTEIAARAVDRVAAKLEYTTLATAFCRPQFTLGELQHVYEAVWGVRLDRSNFRRWVQQTTGLVRPADTDDRRTSGGRGRPAALFEARAELTTLYPPLLRPDDARALRPAQETPR